MAAVTLFPFQTIMLGVSGSLTVLQAALDTVGDKAEIAFEADEAITITRVGVNVFAVNGSSANYSYRVGLQGYNTTTGRADGTWKGGGTPANVVISPTAATGIQWFTLDNSYACSHGERLFLVIECVTTVNGIDFVTFGTAFSPAGRQGFPFAWHIIADVSGGTPIRQSGYASFGYGSATKKYGFPVWKTNTLSASTAGHRVGVKFLLDAGLGATFKTKGLQSISRIQVSGVHKFGLSSFPSSVDTVHHTRLRERELTGDTNPWARCEWRWGEVGVDLSFGTTYYAWFERNDVAITLECLELTDASDGEALIQGGGSWHASTWDGATWTDDATKLPLIAPWIYDWVEPVGGGAASILMAGKKTGGKQ